MPLGPVVEVGRQAGDLDARQLPGELEQLAGERAAADDEDAARTPRSPTSGRLARRFVDQAAGGLGGDPGVAAVGVGADGQPELLVERRAADEDDVVVAHARGP